METIVFDVRTNCRMFLWRYMVAAIVLLFLIGAVIGTEEHNGSNYWHTLIEVFEGIPIYRRNEQQIFRLPVFIMVFQLYLNFLIGSTWGDGLQMFRIMALIKERSRRKWWIEKCAGVIFCVLFYYLIMYLILAAVMFILNGTLSFDSYSVELILNLCALPIVTSIAIGILQEYIGIFFGMVWGYGVCIVLLVASSYWTSPWLIGNNLMMLRNVYISGEGVHLKDGILAGLVLISIIIMAGAHRIRKFDFIQNGRNIN